MGKRWRGSRALPFCDSIGYLPWFHWMPAHWVQRFTATRADLIGVLAARGRRGGLDEK